MKISLLFKKCSYFFLFCFIAINFNKLIALPASSSFLVLDYNSNTIIDSKNAFKRMHPASLTKLISLYVVFDFIAKNKITFDTNINVSKKASNMPSSKLWLKPGETIKLRDAINAMIVKSANDVSYAVAEYLGNGSEKEFVCLMNKKVKELDLKNTHFENSTGLTHVNQYSSAYDMAIIAKSLMLKYPQYYPLFSQKTFVWNNYRYNSTNQLLNYSNVDGLKTGYTYAAGYNLLVSSEINGVRVIISSLGNPSSEIRDNIVRNLVNNGIVLAKNSRLNQILYKNPPNEVVVANNLLNNKINDKIISVNDNNHKINVSNTNSETADDFKILVNNNTNLNNNTENKTITLVNENKNASEAQIHHASLTKNIKNDNSNNLKQPKPIKNQYFIQLGVFSNITNAKFAANKALNTNPQLNKGLLLINKVKINNKNLYRVRINNFSNKEAYSLCQALKNKNIKCFVGLIS